MTKDPTSLPDTMLDDVPLAQPRATLHRPMKAWVAAHPEQADAQRAAPLCAACHDQYGGNPDKRKAIREMRDFWWDLCEKRESNPDLIKLNEKLDSIQIAFQKSETTQQKAFEEIKAALVTFHRSTSDSVLASGSTIELSVKAGYQLPAFFAHFSSCPKCGASSVVARPVRDSSGNQYRECPQCSTRY